MRITVEQAAIGLIQDLGWRYEDPDAIEYLSKPQASVGWQENCFRDPPHVFEDYRKQFDTPNNEDLRFSEVPLFVQ